MISRDWASAILCLPVISAVLFGREDQAALPMSGLTPGGTVEWRRAAAAPNGDAQQQLEELLLRAAAAPRARPARTPC